MNAQPILRAKALVAVALLLSLLVACSSASATATHEPTLAPDSAATTRPTDTPLPTPTPKPTATPTGFLSSIGRKFLRAVKKQQLDQAKAFLCPEIQDDLGLFTEHLTSALTEFDTDLEISSCVKGGSFEQFSIVCHIETPNIVHGLEVYFQIEDGQICDWGVAMIEREVVPESVLVLFAERGPRLPSILW